MFPSKFFVDNSFLTFSDDVLFPFVTSHVSKTSHTPTVFIHLKHSSALGLHLFLERLPSSIGCNSELGFATHLSSTVTTKPIRTKSVILEITEIENETNNSFRFVDIMRCGNGTIRISDK